MADIFAEVDEALKQERLEKLWQRHGKWIVAFIALVILGTAVNAGWKSWNESVQIGQTNTLLAALDSEDVPTALESAASELRPGLRGVALMTAAGSLMQQNKTEDALVLYEKAASDEAIPDDLRDLAALMSVRLDAAKEDAAQKKEEFLSRLHSVSSNAKSPWRFHARLEQAVILAHLAQDYTAAQTQLDVILNAPQLPDSLYNKARALKHVYALRQIESQKLTEERKAP